MSGVKMVEDESFRDDNGKLDLDKIKRYEDSSYKILLLEKYIDEQQDTINKLQEVVAEFGATLLMNGFEIEINGKDLNEMIDDE